jgi:hypothetical protein
MKPESTMITVSAIELVSKRDAEEVNGTGEGPQETTGTGYISGDAAELFVGINVAGDSLACQQKQEIAIGAGDAVISDPGGRRVHRTAPRTVPAFEPHPASTTAMITSPAPRMSLVVTPPFPAPECVVSLGRAARCSDKDTDRDFG